MKKQENMILKAVYEKDVQKLLENLGMLNEVNNGQLHCFICNETITFENFGGIIRKNRELKIFCDKIECYLKMLKKR